MAGYIVFRHGQIDGASLSCVFLGLLALCGAAPLVTAHPLGNFSVNRYSRLDVSSEKVRVFYVLDMAEIPTFQEMRRLDTDGNGTVSEGEKKAYGAVKARELASQLHLQINGNPLTFTPKDWTVTLPLGQAGLPTLRLESTMETVPGAVAAAIHGTEAQPAIFRDENEPERIGWREIVIRGPGVTSQTTGANDITDGLARYPTDRIVTPLDVRVAEFRFLPVPAESAPGAAAGWRELVTTPNDRFAALIATGMLTPEKIVLFLLIAAGLGALHAFSPGHGKTLVGAYLISSRGTPRHALILGMIVTATHTAGVFALGLITLFASHYFLPETLYPWLSAVSGLVIILIGIALLLRRGGLHHHHFHHHDHRHHHEHADGYLHAHAYPRGHTHHQHDEGLAAHFSNQKHDHADRAHNLSHASEHEHEHEHGHSHLPPPGTSITWKSLLALGISGGLVPCPSALVVLLGAIALHRIAFGLMLIVAFSAGLAAVLTGIGVLMVKARDVVAKRVNVSDRLIRVVQKLGAVIIVCIGSGITIPALLTLVRGAGSF